MGWDGIGWDGMGWDGITSNSVSWHSIARLLPFSGGRDGIIDVFGLCVRAHADELLCSRVEVVERRTAPVWMDVTRRQVT